jgi:hypothetical protein
MERQPNSLYIPCFVDDKPLPLQPIYKCIGQDEGSAVDVRKDFPITKADVCVWVCPHCGMEFHRRKPCCQHMGLYPDKGASCPVLTSLEQQRRESRKGAGVKLELTFALWKEAASVAALHLKRVTKKVHQRHDREFTGQKRDYLEALRAAAEGLVCELAFQKKFYPNEKWNAYEENVALADIGELHEVRSVNCMTRLEISAWWAQLGYSMEPGKKKYDIPFEKIRDKGHLEVYKDDKPERDLTFVVIRTPFEASIIGTASIADCQQECYWGKNPWAGKQQEAECYWVPLLVLTPASKCSWSQQPES